MKIGIVGAMEIEVGELKKQLSEREEHKKGSFIFYTGKLHCHEIVLLQSGIGKVNAAVGTAILIDNFKPDCVINTGIAGAFPGKLKVGDIVVSKDLIHHDVDCRVFGYKPGQIPEMPESFVANPWLTALAEKCIRKLNATTAVKASILTGDQFMSDPESTLKLKLQFPDAQAIEMEAAAIAQTCYLFAVDFVVIRSISDVAGQEDAVEYETFAEEVAMNSAKIVIEMIQEINTKET